MLILSKEVLILKKVVGLISDFGEGPYAGIMAEVATCLGGIPLHIDHSVPSFDIVSGAYVTLQAYRWLPKGSSLAVVVDPGVGTERKAIIIKTKNYYLVGPDNGVLYPAAKEDNIDKIYEVDPQRLLERVKRASTCIGFFSHKISKTFHGRDIFAPTATLLTLGIDPEDLTKKRLKEEDIVKLDIEHIEVKNNKFSFKVIYIDKFGNVTLSWRKLPFNLGENVLICDEKQEICLKGKASSAFQDVKIGEALVYINSFGFLEVAINQGNASKKLKVRTGDTLTISKEV